MTRNSSSFRSSSVSRYKTKSTITKLLPTLALSNMLTLNSTNSSGSNSGTGSSSSISSIARKVGNSVRASKFIQYCSSSSHTSSIKQQYIQYCIVCDYSLSGLVSSIVAVRYIPRATWSGR